MSAETEMVVVLRLTPPKKIAGGGGGVVRKTLSLEEIRQVALDSNVRVELEVAKGATLPEATSLTVTPLDGPLSQPVTKAALLYVAYQLLQQTDDGDESLTALVLGILQLLPQVPTEGWSASSLKGSLDPKYASLVSAGVSLGEVMVAYLEAVTLSEAVHSVTALTTERVASPLDDAASYDLIGRYFLEEAFVGNTIQGTAHAALLDSAAALRAVLDGSKRCLTVPPKNQKGEGGKSEENTNQSPAPPALLKAVRNSPTYNGPALDALQGAAKSMQVEWNTLRPVDEDDDDDVENVALDLTVQSIRRAVTTLTRASSLRQSGTAAKADSDASLLTLVSELRKVLQEEAKVGVEFVQAQVAAVEEEMRRKEEEKRARAEAAAAAKQKESSDKDEFAGMTEAQKAKILKKRAEKEAKAAAKKAAKDDANAAAGGADGGPSLNTGAAGFGAGVGPICSALLASSLQISSSCATRLSTTIRTLQSGGVQRKPKVPKGTRDYLPEQMAVRQEAFRIIRRVFESHGAVEIDTPVFELKDTLTGKYGEDSKLIYDLADQGGESLALRYDLTVPFARFLSTNAVGNIKRFHIGKVYRRDQPALSRGRYREFYQCDFDIAGTYGRMIPDAECLSVVSDILSSLPIGDFGIKLNHRRLLDAILDLCGVPSYKFRTICSAVDKLDKEEWTEVRREMVEEKGLSMEVANRIGEFVVRKGQPWDLYRDLMDRKAFGTHAGALEAMEDLRIVFEYLESLGKLQYMSFDLSLARGLDYYTGIIYEAVCMSGNTQVGSIGGGGRYDNLVSMFQEAGKVTPCVGVSVGIERVFTLMEARLREEQGTIKRSNVNVLVASAGDHMVRERMSITRILWDAHISAEFNPQLNPKLKFEIKAALDRGIPFMVIVGEEEAQNGTCKVKDLAAKTEETVTLSELVPCLRSKGVIPVGCEFAAEWMKQEAEEKESGGGTK